MKSPPGLVMVLCVMFLSVGAGSVAAQNSPKRIIAYFSSWSIYERHFFVTDIASDLLTHINYAFFNISDGGECVLGDPWADTQFSYPGDPEGEGLLGNFKQLQMLKIAHPHLQTVMSVGGWSWSGRFSDVALTDDSRQKFAKSCVAAMTQYGFDGIDIDWEYPGGDGLEGNVARPEDPQNFLLLLTELRRQLDAQGTKDGRLYLLTIAAPAGKKQYSRFDLKGIQAQLDWINVMTYDFNGSWSARTAFNAPLYGAKDDPDPASRVNGNADSALQAYLRAGVPADKVVMGVPFYGRGWGGVTDSNQGLFQPYKGIPNGSWGGGAYEYKDLAANYISKFNRYWDAEALVPWLFDPKTGIMISYDDPQSLKAKADYVMKNDLGGMMIWELSNDAADHTLLRAVHDALQ